MSTLGVTTTVTLALSPVDTSTRVLRDADRGRSSRHENAREGDRENDEAASRDHLRACIIRVCCFLAIFTAAAASTVPLKPPTKTDALTVP